MANQQRIDKWLWATRVFKTRSIAADACKKGRVMKGDRTLKPSSMVEVGDVIRVRKPPITFSFEIIDLVNNRVGAKLVEKYLKNVTPASEYEILELQKLSGYQGRPKGLGRPTKKDRRDLEQFIHSKQSADWWEESYLDEPEDEDSWDFDDFWDE
ncbi:S4 domain-containing protein [Porphyromonadaceae bacterium W3.11]|nr:S4 domain-containing protein [Porphyromonadaceae bacterium W3.11]